MFLPSPTIIASLHHLFFTTLALCGGIIIQAYYAPLPSAPTTLTSVLTIGITILALIPLGRRFLWLLLPASFLCGAFCYQTQQDNHSSLIKKYQGYHAKLIGNVVEKELIQHPYLRQRITITLTDATHIYVFTPHVINVSLGDTLQLTNCFISACANKEYEQFLIKEGITFSIFLKKETSYVILALGSPCWQDFFTRQRTRLLDTFKRKFTKETFVLFAALFLGHKQTTKDDLAPYKNLFKQWGILHYLARSGLHVVIIVWLLQFFTRWLPCSLTGKQFFITFFIIFYWLLSWQSTSFMRALITFFLLSWCILARWRSNVIHLLTLSFFFTLLINPLQLFFLDFQLSYGMTYALAFMTFSRHNHT